MGYLKRAQYYGSRIREAGVAATLFKIKSALAPHVWAPLYPRDSGAASDSPQKILRLERLGSGIRSDLLRQAKADVEFVGRCRLRAEAVLSGQWSVLGYGKVAIPRQAGWLRDPVHDHAWPLVYFSRVDYVASGQHCDVKIAWELSRLQYLVWLAEGALLIPDLRDSCIARLEEIVDDWITSNPVGYGVNWACAMEVAIRAVNMMLACCVVADGFSAGFAGRAVRSLSSHYRFLCRFPEISDVPGNHYLADLLGMLVLSVVVENDTTHAKDVKAFTEEAGRQFEPDGCHIERAPIYHRLCTDMVALARAFSIRRSGAVSHELSAIFDASVGFACDLADCRDLLPVIGDCDSGQILEFGVSARSVAGLKALAESRAGGPMSDFELWLRAIGGSGHAIGASLHSPSAVRFAGGLLSATVGELSVAMRVGQQGLKGRASHDHDDAQSIWVSAGGADFIVDEGCHSYTLDAARRAQNISSRAHNVIQAASSPRFAGAEGSIGMTVRGAPVCAEAGITSDGGAAQFTATVVAAKHLADVKRKLRVSRDGESYRLQNEDSWSSDESVELRWHFAPGIAVELVSEHMAALTGEGVAGTVNFTGSGLRAIERFAFQFSPVYGGEVSSTGIRVVAGPAGGGTLVSNFELRLSLVDNRQA
ncbi:heparinase II/III family protein [Tardiphaga sp.]|uniref:heparinase II/III domain-containing protein n=1 Tax=Tardiphaga sp. TaxID=1926292 RepID=UPI002639A4C1|nr:heparinase II/III family protein [Tardiphaga sp.]MDB5618899.1 uncharacterized protein [Tardiphaga sp.]